jgi:hypothetical protein
MYLQGSRDDSERPIPCVRGRLNGAGFLVGNRALVASYITLKIWSIWSTELMLWLIVSPQFSVLPLVNCPTKKVKTYR